LAQASVSLSKCAGCRSPTALGWQNPSFSATMPEARRAGGEAPLSAVEAGGAFVLKYYTTLTKDRDNLHKFYKDESICSRGLEGASPNKITYATGMEEIREEIRSAEPMQATRTEINSFHCQESKQGGILVTVLGYFVYADSPKVHFVQIFFLDKQSDPQPGYFVLNDTLRYISGQPEESDKQADFFSPPPRLPPPMLFANPAEASVESQADAPPQEATAEEEEPWAEEEEEEEEAVADVREVVEEEEDYEAEEPAPAVADGDEEAAVEATDAAQEEADDFDIPEEKPKMSWAAMAGKLGDGGGQLNKSKLSGFALPPPGKGAGKGGQAQAKPREPGERRVLPPGEAKAAAASKNATTSSIPVLPPPTAAAKAKAKAAVAAEDAALERKGAAASDVRMWVSKIPTDTQVENQEVLDCLNKLIADAGLTGQVEIDRKDLTKDWASATVSSQEIADALVQHSKDKTVLLRGKSLKVEENKSKSSYNRRAYNPGNSSGKGGGYGGKEGETKSTEEGKANRGPRRGKGAKGGSDAGPSEKQERSAEGSRPKGGGRKGGTSGGSWRAKSQN